ncbi:hypothetical protein [Bradyrhizobium sp. USDA 4520]
MSTSDEHDDKRFGFIPGGRRNKNRSFLEMTRVEGIFQSAAAKLEWANGHIAELDRQASEHLKSTWSFQLYASPIGGTRLRFNAPHDVRLRFGLMVGDVANNLRSTLDHIVWTVTSPRVREEKLPPEKEEAALRKIQYPFPGKAGLQKAIENTGVIKAGDEAVRIVEKYADAISGLDRLNNDDKHRLTTPLSQVAEIRGFSRKASPPDDYVPTNRLLMGPLHVRDILTGGFPINMDNTGGVDISNFDMTLHLIFVDGPCPGQPVVGYLRHLSQTAEEIVAGFCRTFPGMFSPHYFEGDEDPL